MLLRIHNIKYSHGYYVIFESEQYRKKIQKKDTSENILYRGCPLNTIYT